MEPRPARQQRLVRDLSRFLASIRAGRIGASDVSDEDEPITFHIRQRLEQSPAPVRNSRLRATRRVGPAVPSSRARRIKVAATSAFFASPSQYVLEHALGLACQGPVYAAHAGVGPHNAAAKLATRSQARVSPNCTRARSPGLSPTSRSTLSASSALIRPNARSEAAQ